MLRIKNNGNGNDVNKDKKCVQNSDFGLSLLPIFIYFGATIHHNSSEYLIKNDRG